MAITSIQRCVGDAAGGSNMNLGFFSPVATGNLIVVTIGFQPDTVTVTSVTDNAGNTYIQCPGARTGNTNPGATDIWYTNNSLAGAQNLIVNLSAGVPHGSCMANEFAGAATTSVFNTATNFQSVSAAPVGAAITPGANSGVLTTCVWNTTAFLSSVNAPWGDFSQDSSQQSFSLANYESPAAGSQQAVFNPTGAVDLNTSSASFNLPGGGGPSNAVKSGAFLVF